MRRNASMVALSTLCGLFVPSVLVSTSWTPAASSTGRTAPPAMTPVPREGGFREKRAAPNCPVISHGMVVSLRGTKIRSFLACSTDLRMASGTSRALPRPTPTWPRPSPTTTRAVNEKRRPPFTTLATRLIETTRSVRSSALESIRPSANPSSSEREAAGPCRVGQRLHPPVILVAAAIEHHEPDALGLRPLRDELPHQLGRGHVAAGLELGAELRRAAVDRDQGLAVHLVDGLRADVIQAPEHHETRPRRRALHQAPDARVPDLPGFQLPLREHYLAPAFLPTFLRMYSSAYLMPLPL